VSPSCRWPLVGDGTEDTSYAALEALREDIVPQTVGSARGVEAAVTGETAVSEDFNALVAQRMPIVMGFVLVLAFALLLVAFRSVVIEATVSAAAFVMVAVFAIFVTLSTIDMTQLGFGLAVAILIDATIVRAVLLPATMKLLGRWNWYLPAWLDRLPRLEHERSGDPMPERAAA
jgi:uncharacterized membrane protein YdfJ with MMPL/SSD domain